MEDIKNMDYFNLKAYRKMLLLKGKEHEAMMVLEEMFNRDPLPKELEAARYL